MLTITHFVVRSHDLDYLDLVWEIEDCDVSPYDYTFEIERSESSMGPWDPISPPFSDRYFFRDVMVNQFYTNRQYWYRIKIVRKSDLAVSYSDAVGMKAAPDLIALEVRRLERLLFEEFAGRRCYLFPVRTFGQRCPSCYDYVSGQRLRSQCLDCYDTTYVRGYLDPIEIWVQFDPGGRHVETNVPYQETSQGNSGARMTNFPDVKPRDLIIEAGENKRWRVERVGTTQRLRATLHQELTLHAVPMSDIEYKLPIRVEDVQKLIVSPPRNFINAQQLGATEDEEYWDKIMKVWGYP